MNQPAQLRNLINKYLPERLDPIAEFDAENQLFEAVRQRLKYLLDFDMERLLLLLYRIDVSEDKVRNILAQADPEILDVALTEQVINRIKQKLEMQAKYSTGNY